MDHFTKKQRNQVLGYIEDFVKNKFATIDDSIVALNLYTYSNLDEDTLFDILKFFVDQDYTDETISQNLKTSIEMFPRVASIEDKIKVVDEVVQSVLEYHDIYKSNYDFNIKLISYLVYRKTSGVV